ncbi:MAG TPA: DsbA family protein [Fimbriimonadaceae bacterium]|nr:DsbA family protein [Fimbriimonadaceae bacterium]
MSQTIPLAHDFICPWCWIAVHQIARLRKEFEFQVEWRSYELWPAELERPPDQARAPIPNQAPIPTRLELMLALEHLEIPKIDRPKRMNSHRAHLAAQFALGAGMGEPYILELYKAFWERGENLDEPEILANLAAEFGVDSNNMLDSIRSNRFDDRIVKFDAPAYKTGIFHVPTFIIGGIPYAEQPFHVLQKAMAEAAVRA